MNMNEVVLYAKDARGGIRRWGIKVVDWKIIIQYGLLDGDWQTQEIEVLEGLAGRTREEQIMVRVNSRIKSKIDSGMTMDLENAINIKRVNSLGMPKPMLATKFKNVSKELEHSKIVGQPKLNGNRCLVSIKDGRVIAYSRNGKIIDSIDHIIGGISIDEDVVLDGELYHHGTKLQTLNSWIKKKQQESNNIKYYVYDVILKSKADYCERYNYLKSLNIWSDKVVLIDTFYIKFEEIGDKLNEFVANGYEGLMIRQLHGYEYSDGKRSKGLVKVKKFYDDEFLVVDVNESTEGWGILTCVAKNGKHFNVSSPGTHHEKIEVAENKEKYIGKHINVEYSELTSKGIPFHPVAKYWRDKGGE